ncbi:twin-arginine translocation signal domain-containing protein, partial [Trichlorobacter lovleyi]|uniref:twin-arginine translocation signal domain-containing protein n=1 Tax=Trichlorobacter lovleyi TaxID=313985 RepID=UPI0030B8BEAB
MTAEMPSSSPANMPPRRLPNQRQHTTEPISTGRRTCTMIERRDFLKGCLACGVTAATVSVASGKAMAAGSFEGYPDAMGVLVDLTR